MKNSHIFPGVYVIPRTLVLGENEREVCFCSGKMYSHSPRAMQNSENFQKVIPGLRFLGIGEGRGCGISFSFSNNLLKLFYGVSNAEF